MNQPLTRFLGGYILRPLLVVLGFILSPITSSLDRRIARKHEAKLQQDIRDALSFLFDRHNSSIVPNQGVRFPPGFDYAFVTVEVDTLLIRFCRGRGDLDVRVAAKDAPSEWHELSLLLSLIETKDGVQRRGILDLKDVSRLLAPEIDRLTRAFGGSPGLGLKQRLAAVYADDRVAMRQAEWEISQRLRRP